MWKSTKDFFFFSAAMKSNFFRKHNKDKLAGITHIWHGSLTDHGEFTYCIVICQKELADVIFVPNRLFYFWSYWGLVKTTAESCWEVGLILTIWISKRPIPLIERRPDEATLSSITQLPPSLWYWVPRKQQKVFSFHESSFTAPYVDALKEMEPFRWLNLSLDGLL